MKLARFILLVIFLAPFAHADSGPVNMVLTGVNGTNDGQYYVSPYTGTMNAQTVVLFCDDIKNDIYINEKWAANVTNLATALTTTDGLANTRYGGVAGSPFSDAAFAYQEAAWLTTQFASHPCDLVSLQYALWDIMNPGSKSTSYGDVSTWLGRAANFSSDPNFNPSDFEIVTNVGPLALTGQQQEFIVKTPEPGTLVLLLSGVLALAAFSLLRVRAAA